MATDPTNSKAIVDKTASKTTASGIVFIRGIAVKNLTAVKSGCTKRATPVGSRTDPSLVELLRRLAETLGDGEMARVLNMKKLWTPRDLHWTKDRVHAFRSAHRIKQHKKVDDPDVLTGQQAREYLGVGYHGLVALIRRGVLHTNQVTDFAPWRLSRAELDSEQV